MKADDYLKAVHDEVHAEHRLISDRMTWYVTSQSFLVAAYAFSTNRAYELPGHFSDAIAWISLGISFVTAIAIYSALFAQRSLAGEEYSCICKKLKDKSVTLKMVDRRALEEYLRTIACYGRASGKWTHLRGMIPPAVIPAAFICFWGWVLCIESGFPCAEVYARFLVGIVGMIVIGSLWGLYSPPPAVREIERTRNSDTVD